MENYFNVKFTIAEILKQPLSEIEALPFYEIEMLIEWLEEREKKRKDNEKGDKTGTMQQPNANKLMRDAQRQVPKINIPKIR